MSKTATKKTAKPDPRVVQLTELVRRLEWVKGECPACGNSRAEGHAEGCQVAGALV